MRRTLVAIAMLVTAIPVLAQDAGWIGISIEDQKDRGAVVRSVEPNSPAEKAGLKSGDVILEYNHEQVIGVQQLTRLVRETPAGRTVDVKVQRDNREETLKVTTEAGSRRSGYFSLSGPFGQVFAMPSPPVPPVPPVFPAPRSGDFPRVEIRTIQVVSGIRVEELTDQLRDFFGVLGNEGVLVTSVDSGSAAEKAGLKAGDVIVAVDNRNVRTSAEFSREMRADSKPMLKTIRDKKERELRIE
jgi:serine protease Do